MRLDSRKARQNLFSGRKRKNGPAMTRMYPFAGLCFGNRASFAEQLDQRRADQERGGGQPEPPCLGQTGSAILGERH